MMTDYKTAGFIFVCFVLPQGLLAALNCSSPTPEALFDAFEKDLFPKKMLRPVKSFSETLNITISITVVGILGVNEKAQTLTTFLWEVLEWDIYGLSWDEKECGAARVSIPRANIWSPDVLINEFMDKDDSPKSPYVYLYNSGRVFDDKPRRVVSYCRMVIYTFPFDVQDCSLTFTPYLHFGMDITMVQGMSATEILEESLSVIQTNGEWELVDIRVSQESLLLEEGSYSEIRYNIILRRRPMLYVVNLLIPSCFLIAVDLFSFLLPPQSVDRSAFKMTLILGYTVFLLIMNDLLPTTGETTPLINILFSISLGLMVASLLETVFITNIHFKSSQYSSVPPWLRTLVLHYMAVVVRLPPAKRDRSSFSQHQSSKVTTLSATSIEDRQYAPEHASSSKGGQDSTLAELRRLNAQLANIRVQVDQHIQGSLNSEEWALIGIIIDRLLFGIYLLFILIAFSCFLCIWILSYSYVK